MAVTASRTEKAYEKYAWVLLVVAEIFAMIFALADVFATTAIFKAGFSSAETLGPNATGLIEGLSSLWVGMNLFGLAITLKPYRNGEKWAWIVLWYIPVIFSLHFLLLFPTVVPNLLLAVLPFLGLVLSYRKFFSGKPA